MLKEGVEAVGVADEVGGGVAIGGNQAYQPPRLRATPRRLVTQRPSTIKITTIASQIHPLPVEVRA